MLSNHPIPKEIKPLCLYFCVALHRKADFCFIFLSEVFMYTTQIISNQPPIFLNKRIRKLPQHSALMCVFTRSVNYSSLICELHQLMVGFLSESSHQTGCKWKGNCNISAWKLNLTRFFTHFMKRGSYEQAWSPQVDKYPTFMRKVMIIYQTLSILI